MLWTKAKITIAVGVGLLLAVGITTSQLKKHKPFNGESEIDAYISDQNLEDYKNAPELAVIQPTHFPKHSGVTGHFETRENKFVGRDNSLKDMIVAAYEFHTPRIVFPDTMPMNRYDFLITVSNQPREQFQSEIEKVLGYSARKETRDVDIQVLKVADSAIGKLKAGRKGQSARLDSAGRPTGSAFNYSNHPVSVLAEALEYRFRMPVIDRTGLVGNYDMVVDFHWTGDWNGKDREANLNSLKKTILDQLGLELVPSREPVEMLVVERVK